MAGRWQAVEATVNALVQQDTRCTISSPVRHERRCQTLVWMIAWPSLHLLPLLHPLLLLRHAHFQSTGQHGCLRWPALDCSHSSASPDPAACSTAGVPPVASAQAQAQSQVQGGAMPLPELPPGMQNSAPCGSAAPAETAAARQLARQPSADTHTHLCLFFFLLPHHDVVHNNRLHGQNE